MYGYRVQTAPFRVYSNFFNELRIPVITREKCFYPVIFVKHLRLRFYSQEQCFSVNFFRYGFGNVMIARDRKYIFLHFNPHFLSQTCHELFGMIEIIGAEIVEVSCDH